MRKISKKSQSAAIFAAALLVLALAGSVILSDFEGLRAITGLDIFGSAIPAVSNIFLNSSAAANTTVENLTLYWTATDGDGDRIINITDWRVNGDSIAKLYLPFEADGLNNITDYSSYNHTGILNGEINWSPNEQKHTFTDGAYYFDGGGTDFIEFNQSDLNITDNSITVMAWINNTVEAGFDPIIQNSKPSPDGGGIVSGYSLLVADTNVFWDVATANGYERTTTSGVLPIGKWVHFAGVYNGTDLILYMNGTVLDTEPASGNINSTSNSTYIGKDTTSTNYFVGFIDEVRVYDRALSHEQIITIYNDGRNIISSHDTTQGEQWTACITPNDGSANGAKVCSNNLTIIPPGIRNIQVTNITTTSAIINWSTIASANGTLSYGTAMSLGINRLSSVFDNNRTFSLTGLANNTMHYYNVTSFDRYGSFETNGTFNFTTLSAPIIAAVTHSGITNQSAVINWTTNENSNTSVTYGTSLALGSASVLNDAAAFHTRTITGLSGKTFYYYNVTSCSQVGSCQTNGSFNFTTANTVPSISSIIINTTYAVNTTNESIAVYWSSADQDGDAIYNVTDWRINGTSIAVLNMPFENNSNVLTNATDYSTYQNDGVVSGASFNLTAGYLGSGAYNFDGSSDFITIERNSSLDFTEKITISAWVKTHAGGYVLAKEAFNYTCQWASGAVCTSEYGPGNGCSDMIGVPTISSCGDQTNAWASTGGASDSAQLNLTYSNSVYATSFAIYETNVDGFISKVEFENNAGSVSTVWEDTDDTVCAGYLNESFTITSTKGNKLVLYTDGAVGGYEEIDAVQLCGYQTAGLATVPFALTTFRGGEFFIINDSTRYNATAGGNINDSSWHHVAATYNGSEMKIYVDGSLSATSTAYRGRLPITTNNIILGRNYDLTNTSGNLNGTIDNLIIYNRVLSAEQVLALYQNGTSMIVSQETNTGENWTACITPNDRIGDGTIVCSNNLTILSPDTTAPALSSVSASTSVASAEITWNTNEKANSTFSYGLTILLGTNSSNATFSASHSMTLTGLSSTTFYYYNITSCDIWNNCIVNGTFNFTTDTPPTPDRSGGSDYRAEPETPAVPAEEQPAPIEPVEEIPKPAALTSISPSHVNPKSVACSEIADGIIPQKLEYKPFEALTAGYETIVPEFAAECKADSMRITLSIPDSYTNITALRCAGGSCSSMKVVETPRLRCGGKIFEDVKRTSKYIKPEFFPIELVSAESVDKNEIESSNTKIKFAGEAGKVSLTKPDKEVEEAANPMIKIVGTPTVLKFEKIPESINATLPYALPEHVDELSIAIYARKDNKWIYLGGNVDTNSKTVSANIENASEYAEKNKITLATMGLICLNCFEAKLEKVYDGGSRDSVVLVHGFENTPERFEDIINDIRLTNQPWQAWTFGYPSNNPIDENAKDLADLLQAHKRDSDFVYIAAHSLGGLITQEALYYAYTENKKNPESYAFVNDITKVVLIATPNKGALTKDPKNLFNMFINSETLVGLFNVNSDIIKELIEGKDIPRVPGIEYLVVAGTQPYEFSKLLGLEETSDGLVSLSSAQTVGGELVDNYCSNFWSFNTTHTDILNNYDSRKIVERIVAKEVAEFAPEKAIMGHNKYYNLEITSCNPDDKYIIIGIPVREEAKPAPGLCSCGNGICGVDENEVSCPSDCARIEKPKASIWGLLLEFKPLRNLMIALIVIAALVIILARRHKKTEPTKERLLHKLMHIWHKLGKKGEAFPFEKELHPAAPDHEREKLLNNLIIHARASSRLGEHSRAAVLHDRFNKEYDAASMRLKDKFKEAADKIKKEVKRK